MQQRVALPGFLFQQTSRAKKHRRCEIQPGPPGSGRLYIRGLLTFRALRYFKLNLLAFFEGLEAVHLNGRKMGEQIFATVIRRDKAETFGIVKPLDSTCCHSHLSKNCLITQAAG